MIFFNVNDIFTFVLDFHRKERKKKRKTRKKKNNTKNESKVRVNEQFFILPRNNPDGIENHS